MDLPDRRIPYSEKTIRAFTPATASTREQVEELQEQAAAAAAAAAQVRDALVGVSGVLLRTCSEREAEEIEFH